jgi:Mrp family chromosome partitioning ATPase
MGRMLDALKTLEERSRPAVAPEQQPPAVPEPAPSQDWESLLEHTSQLVDEAAGLFDDLPPLTAPDPLELAPVSPLRGPTLPAAPFETCMLPVVSRPAEWYREMATRISERGATNYSNVVLLVAADRWVEPAFSIVELAQCFAEQLAGDVLLVDGDLRQGKLSRSVARPGVGMVEAMLGQAQWPDIIHPTNVPRIDFVARGNAQVPTFERPQFGWGALRPLYRLVLIGLASQAEPETSWLAARCDAVYILLSRIHTRRSSASAAVNALRASGANVAGCIVVND